MRKNRTKLYLVNFIIAVAIMIFATISLRSSSAGKTGQTSVGCTCHGTNQAATSFAISNSKGSWNINTNETVRITVTLSHSTKTYAGIDIGVKSASFGGTDEGVITNSSSNSQILDNEVTHNGIQSFSGSIEFSFDWTAPAVAGTYYVQVAGNAVNYSGNEFGDTPNKTTQAINVSVAPNVTITSPNGNESYCPGGNANITWTQSGASLVNITLSSDGGNSFPTTIATNIPATALSYNWNISSGLTPGGLYKVKLTDANNSALTSTSAVNFSLATPTSITKQPLSKTLCTGNTYNLEVDASGGALTYQWKLGNNPIQGATSKTYTISNAIVSFSGNYTCVVTGSCGNPITSSPANINILSSPSITSHPHDLTACEGGTAVLYGGATGDNLTFKWTKDGIDIPNTSSQTLTLDLLTQANAGSYRLVAISEGCGSFLASNEAILSVTPPPTILQQPVGTSACEGSIVKLFVETNSSATSTQWFHNGTILNNQTSNTLTLSNFNVNDAGAYNCTVKGNCQPSISSATVYAYLMNKPTIYLHPLNKSSQEGTKISLTVAAQNSGTMTAYQWKKGTTDLAGATSATLTFNSLTLADAGDYICVVSNECGGTPSNIAKVKVIGVGEANVTFANDLLIVDTLEIQKAYDFEAKNMLKNTGNKDANITGLTVTGQLKDILTPKGITFPFALKAGETKSITFDYKPSKRGTSLGQLQLTMDGTTEPLVGGVQATAYVMDAPVTLSKPSLEVTSPKLLVLGENKIGLINTVTNINSAHEKVTNIEFSNPAFSAKPGLTIAPSKEEKLSIEYTPTVETNVPAEASIYFEFAKKPLTLQLVGKVGIQSIDIDENLVEQLQVSPNPASDFVNIKFANPKDFTVELSIVDIHGNQVKSFGIVADKSAELNWNCKNELNEKVSNGTYIGILKSNGKFKIFKIEIAK